MVNLLLISYIAYASKTPNICDVVKLPQFENILDISYKKFVCGFPPRVCVSISYYVPKYFIEVVNKPKDTFFKDLPGVALQLATTTEGLESGVDDDQGSYSYDAHTIRIPYASSTLFGMPCSSSFARVIALCKMR